MSVEKACCKRGKALARVLYQAKKCGPVLSFGPRAGSVLIVVMWISFGLVSVALLFGHSMMLEYRAAENTLAGLQAQAALEGARRYVTRVLREAETPGRLPDVDTYDAENVQVGEAAFWLLGRGDQRDSEEGPIFSLVDECSKLNLNTATLEMLEALPEMTAELAASIIDWRDSDGELTPNGAESQYYLLREPGYLCKDSPFETVQELRLVMGGEWSALFGEDSNLNGVLDPNENDGDVSFPEDNENGRLEPGILEYVTVYSQEPNRSDDASARINLNDAYSGANQAEQQLRELLGNAFGTTRGDEIFEAASSGPSPRFNSLIDFYLRSQMTLEEFDQVYDSLTVSDEDVLPGLVNVNTAGAAVLSCLPGITEDMAEQLVSYRQGKGDQLASVAWITEILEDESALQAGPYITARSYQYAADVAAVGRRGKGFRRVLYVFDTRNEGASLLYRQDRGRLGWSLGNEIREQLLLSDQEKGEKRFQ